MATFLFSAFLLLSVTFSSGEITPMDYWNEMLPTTPMPYSLKAFLPSGDLVFHKDLGNSTCFGIYHYYRRGTTKDELKSNRDVDFLFLQTNLKPGSKTKKIDFVEREREGSGWPTFLPRKAAEAIPFSTSKLGDILEHFSVDPTSVGASIIKKTLESCEMPHNKGETSYCTTSLESMIDFAISQLKTHEVQLLATSVVNKEKTEPKSRVYTIQTGMVELPTEHAVVCHRMPYPIAVFACHKTTNTKSYIVPLVAEEDGTKVNAVAVCHIETSSWNPNHATILALGIKPGTPVCHFLHHGHYAWVPNSGS